MDECAAGPAEGGFEVGGDAVGEAGGGGELLGGGEGIAEEGDHCVVRWWWD